MIDRVLCTAMLMAAMYFVSGDIESCYLGTYTVKLPPFNSCSGFRDCEIGNYCEKGKKIQCPGGTFGQSTRLSNSSCSGQCHPGFYCPVGSVSATANYCGNISVYCPIGSSEPKRATPGYYTTNENGSQDRDSETRRSAVRLCPPGSYCADGTKNACPSGVYGLEAGLSDAACTAPCPEGWFCPPGTERPFSNPCSTSPTEYCPAGSSRPELTKFGYYAVQPHINEGGGFGAIQICPRGSYCVAGQRHDCPAGRYGSALQTTDTSCSGECAAGFYCPAGSITFNEVQCDSTAVYCPTGSSEPTTVSPGHYTIGHSSDAGYDGNVFRGQANVGQALCEPGYYCLRDGIKRRCPAGRYGAQYGVTNRDCDGPCKLGHYCPEGSTSATQMRCGDADPVSPSNLFCVPGSAVPQTIHSGYYSGELQRVTHRTCLFVLTPVPTVLGDDEYTRGGERRCEPGFFCRDGVKHLCAGGFYGEDFGEVRQSYYHMLTTLV